MPTADDGHADALEQSRTAQRERVLHMTPAERFVLMDDLCRELTWIAANAKRV